MNIAKFLIFLGIFIAFIGMLVFIGEKLGIPFGKMPGDITVKKEKYSIYFPIVTFILISIFITIFLNLIFWIFRK